MGKRARIVGFVVLVIGVLVPVASASASQYVALGDSYSAGVGSRVFYEESGECKRSPDAYPPKIAAAKGYTLNFEACSGAKTPEVNEKQLGKLSSTTSLVTITIGGNDAGFSNVISTAHSTTSPAGARSAKPTNSSRKNCQGFWKPPTKTSAPRRPPPR